MNQHHVIIIGGGITGLSAAWELQQQNIAYTLLEAGNRWGGKVTTDIIKRPGKGQFIIDGGPESFITRKPEVWDLAIELGMEETILPVGSETRNMYVLDNGIAKKVPLDPILFIKSPLLSWKGKFRLLVEPFIPPRRDQLDESLAEFANRRLGVEAQEKFIGPILAGIYNTNPQQQSILTTSPIMREMELEHGSLVRAVISRMVKGQKNNKQSNNKKPRFITFTGGAQELVNHLVGKLTGDLRLNTPVKSISEDNRTYMIELGDKTKLRASAVILCSPASAAAKILADTAPEAAQALTAIRQTNIGTISLIYRNGDIPNLGEINGIMIPRREKRSIDAITFTSLKLPSRAPQGFTLIRAYFGGARPELAEIPKIELIDAVRKEFAGLLGITATPIEVVAFRWANAFPQADVGHLDRIDAIETLLPKTIALAGASYRGIGVPDCIRQGRAAAKNITNFLIA